MPAEIYGTRLGEPDHTIAVRFVDASLLLLALALVLSDTMTRSYFSIIFFGDSAFGAFLMINFGVILFFAGVAALRGDLFILTIFAAIATFFLCYYLYFIVSADRPLDFNSLGGYYGTLAVIVFYELARQKLLPLTMRLIFLVYAAYLVIYAILVMAGLLGLDISFASQKVTVDISDPDRENRIFMFAAAATYVAAYSVSKLKQRIQLGYILTLALAGFTAYLSLMRTFILYSLLVVVLYLWTGRMKLVQRLSFLGSVLIAAYLTYGIVDPGFNPYRFSVTDVTTLARAYQFDVVADYVRKAPIFGIGLPDATDGLTYFLGKEIFPSDLGIVGIWFQFGIAGVVLLGIVPIYISCVQDVNRSNSLLGEVDTLTLSLTGCIIGLVGGAELYIDSALLFSLIFANTLYNGRVAGLLATERRQWHGTRRLRRTGGRRTQESFQLSEREIGRMP
jgi:hypothetical protein